jgi:DNA-binding XRE family transcriptional regulator
MVTLLHCTYATILSSFVDYSPWIVSPYLVKLWAMTTTKDPTLVAIGRNLRRIRTASGFSQEGLALDAEIDRTYISQIERGIANPSVLVLKKISDCLKIGLSDLVVGV